MNVPFLELKPTYLELKDQFDAAYHRVMDSGWYLLGQETEAFEEEYARYCGVKHCVTVANGMDALTLSLRALGIRPGDEVIVPTHTFIATWLAVSQVGATPVPVEPNPDTCNIDPGKIENAITEKTKAIVPVHLYGQTADMDPIMRIANKHSLVVIEDAAQSQGALHNKQRSGSLAHSASHSFYPGKNLGAFSDGGAVTTNDASLAKNVRKLRNYGSHVKYQHEQMGVNSRMDETQAAFLRIKLQYLDEWNSRRKSIAKSYLDQMAGIPLLKLPTILSVCDPVWHLFVIQHPQRDRLQKMLSEAGVGTLIHYPVPCHCATAYEHLEFEADQFPVANHLANSVLSLPIGPQQTSESTEYVVETLRSSLVKLEC